MASDDESSMIDGSNISVISAATTVFHGDDDPVGVELRALRKKVTAARRAFVQQYEDLVTIDVSPPEVLDEHSDVDDMRYHFGELLQNFVKRAHEILNPALRSHRVRLTQVASAVERARQAWDSTRYFDDAAQNPERLLHIPTREDIEGKIEDGIAGPKRSTSNEEQPQPSTGATHSTARPRTSSPIDPNHSSTTSKNISAITTTDGHLRPPQPVGSWTSPSVGFGRGRRSIHEAEAAAEVAKKVNGAFETTLRPSITDATVLSQNPSGPTQAQGTQLPVAPPQGDAGQAPPKNPQGDPVQGAVAPPKRSAGQAPQNPPQKKVQRVLSPPPGGCWTESLSPPSG